MFDVISMHFTSCSFHHVSAFVFGLSLSIYHHIMHEIQKNNHAQ